MAFDILVYFKYLISSLQSEGMFAAHMCGACSVNLTNNDVTKQLVNISLTLFCSQSVSFKFCLHVKILLYQHYCLIINYISTDFVTLTGTVTTHNKILDVAIMQQSVCSIKNLPFLML